MAAKVKPLSLLPLIALIFYDVSGGPFGIEVGQGSGTTTGSGAGQGLGLAGTSLRATGGVCPNRFVRASAGQQHTAGDARRRAAAGVLTCCAPNHHIPLDTQDAVSAGAPLLAVIGFIVLPIIWSVPEALVTAGGSWALLSAGRLAVLLPLGGAFPCPAPLAVAGL